MDNSRTISTIPLLRTDATPVTPRVVFADGELLIDGVAVCPTCLEDKRSKFCPCNPDDLIRELGLAVLREQRAEVAR